MSNPRHYLIYFPIFGLREKVCVLRLILISCQLNIKIVNDLKQFFSLWSAEKFFFDIL
jgi:hypothetical protein